MKIDNDRKIKGFSNLFKYSFDELMEMYQSYNDEAFSILDEEDIPETKAGIIRTILEDCYYSMKENGFESITEWCDCYA